MKITIHSLALLLCLALAGCGDGNKDMLSNYKLITEFSVNGQQATIDHPSGSISIALPPGTDLSQVVPTIMIGKYAQVTPQSGQAVDLRHGVTYSVKAQNGERKEYVATATVEE